MHTFNVSFSCKRVQTCILMRFQAALYKMVQKNNLPCFGELFALSNIDRLLPRDPALSFDTSFLNSPLEYPHKHRQKLESLLEIALLLV